MSVYRGTIPQDSYLAHYGTPGQKWGERLYQFLDGTRTPLGLEREREMRAANGATTREPDGANLSAKKIVSNVKSSYAQHKENVAEKKRIKDDNDRDRIVRSGSIKEVLDNSGRLTDDERRRALSRLRDEDAMRDLYNKDQAFLQKNFPKEKTIAEKRVDKIVQEGSASAVLHASKDMTPEQRQRALNRLQNEKSIKEMADAQKLHPADLAKHLMTAAEYVDKAVSIGRKISGEDANDKSSVINEHGIDMAIGLQRGILKKIEKDRYTKADGTQDTDTLQKEIDKMMTVYQISTMGNTGKQKGKNNGGGNNKRKK